jgi:hypothetical protein
MDETNIPFYDEGKKTIELRGSKTVGLRIPKRGNQSATACLAVSLAGNH